MSVAQHRRFAGPRLQLSEIGGESFLIGLDYSSSATESGDWYRAFLSIVHSR